IGSNTNASGSIIDNNTIVGQNCNLENGTVIGPRVIIRDDATIHSDVKIWPEVTIKAGSRIKETIINPEFD
ncbi:MAG: NDP-sugar synthase, partial [Methanococcoides sp.]|nr:NDP-sugar synthase [Methanococcoides sp.]